MALVIKAVGALGSANMTAGIETITTNTTGLAFLSTNSEKNDVTTRGAYPIHIPDAPTNFDWSYWKAFFLDNNNSGFNIKDFKVWKEADEASAAIDIKVNFPDSIEAARTSISAAPDSGKPAADATPESPVGYQLVGDISLYNAQHTNLASAYVVDTYTRNGTTNRYTTPCWLILKVSSAAAAGAVSETINYAYTHWS